MKRILYVLTLFAASVAGLSSCSSDSSTVSVTAAGDCAITGITMGTMVRTVYTTTAAGADTSYNVAVAGAAFPMYVDQLRQEIYNPDSLPLNTNVKKVVLSSINADGVVAYRTPYGNDTLFSTNDTLDFTNPVLFTCYSADGMQSKTYSVKVNVHKSNSESFSWITVADGVPLLSDGIGEMKAFVCDGRLMVFALRDGQSLVLWTATDAPDSWESSTVSGLTDMQPAGVQMFGGRFYYADGSKLMVSDDGKEWQKVDTPQPFLSLVAVGRDMIYARAADGIYASADGQQWQAGEPDSELTGFPWQDLVSVWNEMSFNDNFYYVLACGRDDDGQVSIWKKIVDANGADTEPWQIFPQGESGDNDYPALSQTSLLAYDGKVLCAGLDGGEVSNLYVSSDGGRSWLQQSANYSLPKGLEAETFSMTADENDFIWIVCAPSGKVVKGRLNRLGYENQQKVFDQ